MKREMKNNLILHLAVFGILSAIFILVFTISCSVPLFGPILFSLFGFAAIGSIAGFTVTIVKIEKEIKEEEKYSEKGKENEEN